MGTNLLEVSTGRRVGGSKGVKGFSVLELSQAMEVGITRAIDRPVAP